MNRNLDLSVKPGIIIVHEKEWSSRLACNSLKFRGLSVNFSCILFTQNPLQQMCLEYMIVKILP